MSHTSRPRFALLALMMAMIVLALLKFGWGAPRPLILTSAAIFCACLALFWVTHSGPQSAGFPQALLLILTWMMTTAASLAILYRWDHAGWLWFKATGYDVVLQENLQHLVARPVPLFVAQNRIFTSAQNDSTKIILRKGSYDFNKTCIVPQGTTLVIEPGTVLRFRAGCSLISYSPIQARGTENEPVVFTSKDSWRKWGSVGIISKGCSIFEYTIFENGRRAYVNGVDFWGALSLFEAEVEIANSEFRNLYGKDGVNITNGRVRIRDNVFRNCYKDGLDLDAGSGEISNNTFIDCDDEGIDLSANLAIRVFNNTILDSRGGRLGADENYDEIVAANKFGYSNK